MQPSYRVMEVGRSAVSHLVRAHYLHSWPGVTVATLALLDGWNPIGCVVFALPPRESMTRYGVTEAWELARLFIVDGTPKNTETWFVARAIKWIKRNHPSVSLLISYADPSRNHTGVIYRAGSWISDGMTDDERNTPRFDYVAEAPARAFEDSPRVVKYSRHSHIPEGAEVTRLARVSKHRFVYWLDRSHESKRQGSEGV